MKRQAHLSKVLAVILLVLLCRPWPVLSSLSDGAREPVSDTHTEIQFLIYHVHPKASVRPLLRDLVAAFQRPARSGQIHWVTVTASEENAAAIRESTGLAGLLDFASRADWIVMPEAYDTWARDLYTVFRKKEHYEILPLYPGGRKTGEAMAQVLPAAEPWSSSPGPVLPFAGGDLASDDRFVYLGEKSLLKICTNAQDMSGDCACTNVQALHQRGSEINPSADCNACTNVQALHQRVPEINPSGDCLNKTKKYLEEIFGKELIVLPGEDEHQDRYHLPIGIIQGKRTSLLADPLNTLEILRRFNAEEKEKMIRHYMNVYQWQASGQTRVQMERFFSRIETEAEALAASPYVQSLDRVEKTLQAHGIRVIRIPTLNRKLIPEDPFPLGFYYVNLVQDTYEDLDGRPRRKFVLPAYGIETLDRTVFEMIKALEEIHEIRMVAAEIEGFRGAGIRCLLQVMGMRSNALKKGD